MIDDRDKLALFLIVLALFCAVFGGFLTKAMEYIGSFGEFEVPERDQSPYLYKGAGEGEKDRVEPTESELKLEGTIWGQKL
jgi:hypothetical protein